MNDEFNEWPKWTVIYHTHPVSSSWAGTAWDFFDNEETASRRYAELKKQELAICMRPFYPTDKKMLAAIPKWGNTPPWS